METSTSFWVNEGDVTFRSDQSRLLHLLQIGSPFFSLTLQPSLPPLLLQTFLPSTFQPSSSLGHSSLNSYLPLSIHPSIHPFFLTLVHPFDLLRFHPFLGPSNLSSLTPSILPYGLGLFNFPSLYSFYLK